MKQPQSVFSRIKNFYWLLCALALSAGLQLSFINKSSVWHDEGYSLWLVKYDWSELLSRTARDVHPPLYYLGLKLWQNVFGSSQLAARSFSTAAILATIVFMYLLLRRLFNERIATITSMLLAISPFLIRYGQEARMYALLALLATIAAYVLVTAIRDNNNKLLYLYGAVMALAFYTHYYAVFMVAVLWVYVIAGGIKRLRVSSKSLLKNKHWWGANIFTLLLFAPWLPVAYRQFTRVQGGFWIPPVDSLSLPHTLTNWVYYDSLSNWPQTILLLVPLIFLACSLYAILYDKSHRESLVLLLSWALLTPALVFIISALSRPVYIDRYFVFSAIGFYALLPILTYVKPFNVAHRFRPIILLLLGAILLGGIRNVYLHSTHQMDKVADYANQHVQAQDTVVAGELYVYLDFRYYQKFEQATKLYAPSGVSGFGETSLFYDQPKLIVKNWDELSTAQSSLWVVGKVGDKSYYIDIPKRWRQETSFQAGESIIRQFKLRN